MLQNKSKYVKKYSRLLRKKNTTEAELGEVDRKLSEDVHENEEGLGIDEEEEKVEESYLGIGEEIEHEDNPDKEDE